VTVQAQILQLIKALQVEYGMALVMVTHDLGVVAETCDRVTVMYGGKVMETARVGDIFDRPRHPYTQALLGSMPGQARAAAAHRIPGASPNPADPPTGCPFHPAAPRPRRAAPPRCRHDADRPGCHGRLLEARMTAPALELRGLSKSFTLKSGLGPFARFETIHALRGVDLVLPRRSILGLVGESGSGKTTTGMVALRLTEPTAGRILVDGRTSRRSARGAPALPATDAGGVPGQLLGARPDVHALEIVAEPLHVHGIGTPASRGPGPSNGSPAWARSRLRGPLPPRALGRAAAACGHRPRAHPRPEVLIADEPTSALDVSVKAQIINLCS
jgi:oligopeptide/dipeptide ABC transporter ATP-binding protein